METKAYAIKKLYSVSATRATEFYLVLIVF
jgi:hypothetical protein